MFIFITPAAGVGVRAMDGQRWVCHGHPPLLKASGTWYLGILAPAGAFTTTCLLYQMLHPGIFLQSTRCPSAWSIALPGSLPSGSPNTSRLPHQIDLSSLHHTLSSSNCYYSRNTVCIMLPHDSSRRALACRHTRISMEYRLVGHNQHNSCRAPSSAMARRASRVGARGDGLETHGSKR